MDMLEVLAEASESSNVAYNDFLLSYKTGKQIVYGFIEGKDDPSFYRGFIENALVQGWECKLIQAGNKKKVLEIYSRMDWSRFPRKAICFFVDRDLSEFIEGEQYAGDNLFVSDHYSIENEIVNIHTMKRVFDEVQAIGALSPEEEQILSELFAANLAYFKESLACVMAQIVIWRIAEQRGDNLVARLNNIKVKTYYDFDGGRILLRPEYLEPQSRVIYASNRVGAPMAEPPALRAAEDEFRNKLGVEKFVRGKYILWFFVECLEMIRQALPVILPRFRIQPGSSGGLGTNNAMMIIGPRARCPDTLREFMTRNYLEYIASRLQAQPSLN